MKDEYVAPCGIICCTCIAFQGYTKDGKRRKKSCPGCKKAKKLCPLKKKCKKLRDGKITYCYLCDDFPCDALSDFDWDFLRKYGISPMDNLRYIEKNGLYDFLAKYEYRFQCPKCKNIRCVQNGFCYACLKRDAKRNK